MYVVIVEFTIRNVQAAEFKQRVLQQPMESLEREAE